MDTKFKRIWMVAVPAAILLLLMLSLGGCSWFNVPKKPIIQEYPVSQAVEILQLIRNKNVALRQGQGAYHPYPLLKEGLDLSGVTKALDAGARADGIRALVIDDFVQYGRDNCVWVREGYCHGDYVAAILLAVAPQATVYVCDVFHSDNLVSDCLKEAIDDPEGFHVINMSLSFVGYYRFYEGPVSETRFFCPPTKKEDAKCVQDTPGFKKEVDLISDYLNQLASRGTQPVAAAGNECLHNGVAFPAYHDAVIASGAVYDAYFSHVEFRDCEDYDAQPGEITCFSNYGRDLYNIGWRTDISLGEVKPEKPYSFGGTSGASPFNAGAIALVAGTCRISPQQAAEKLKQFAIRIDDKYNTGLLNQRTYVWDAVRDCLGQPPPPEDTLEKVIDKNDNCIIDDDEIVFAVIAWLLELPIKVGDKEVIIGDEDILHLIRLWVAGERIC